MRLRHCYTRLHQSKLLDQVTRTEDLQFYNGIGRTPWTQILAIQVVGNLVYEQKSRMATQECRREYPLEIISQVPRIY